ISPQSKLYTDKSKRKPLSEYLKMQGRFMHLTDEDIRGIENKIDENWKLILELEKYYSTKR
ncbi:MAG: pyruvate synthase subunit beta, partial [Acidilobaceae archaeon]